MSNGTVYFDLLLGKGGESRKSKVGNENVVCHNLGYGAGNRNIRHEIATLYKMVSNIKILCCLLQDIHCHLCYWRRGIGQRQTKDHIQVPKTTSSLYFRFRGV